MSSQNADFLPGKQVHRSSLSHLLAAFACRMNPKIMAGAATLPDDLQRDVGLREKAPAERGEAFWRLRQGSHMRDLPF